MGVQNPMIYFTASFTQMLPFCSTNPAVTIFSMHSTHPRNWQWWPNSCMHFYIHFECRSL